MEVKYGTYIILLCVQNLFIISAAQKCQYHTVCTKRRLNHVWNVLLICFIIKIGQILSGYILMLCQIIIGSVGNAPELAPAKGEQELYVCSGLAVET